MIPRILHQLWIGSPLPLEIADMMATWKRLHPEWEYRFWTEANLPPLVNQDLYDRAPEITPTAVEQFRADVARYEILHTFGGVWVDADFTCQLPIDDLLTTKPFAGREGRWLNNALIGSPPAHPMLHQLIEGLAANVARCKPTQGNTVKSGPQYFTPIARRWKIIEYPQDMFYPYLWNELDRRDESFPLSYAVHHWGNRRRMRGESWT